ncbi:hypothetical protein CMUS01_10646 [Colletotrichum musicola]|uniref:Uncharacterized protein n=1 Tax=Colletotrichum musicola TaxID=2175873 RepID=A0A8H6K3B5_9PEZI|nr:hypothetical protein CMUS01_10646 [Colletotrichum musicola]
MTLDARDPRQLQRIPRTAEQMQLKLIRRSPSYDDELRGNNRRPQAEPCLRVCDDADLGRGTTQRPDNSSHEPTKVKRVRL